MSNGQKALLEQNTRQFLQGKPANNVLLTGARGTGKSSLVRACLNEFSDQGLRLIEVDKDDLIDLEEISVLTATRRNVSSFIATTCLLTRAIAVTRR